jgi:aspartyl-tRNA(Asn)/glutamyl-tRNA(Gln) amidotransferase subunit A
MFRDLADAPLVASLFASKSAAALPTFNRFAVIDDSFLHDCEPGIVQSLRAMTRRLQSLGLEASTFDPGWWADSFEIFAPIQASEAARLHAGHFDRFEPSIRERLEWGAALSRNEIASLRQRHASFQKRMDDLFASSQLLLLPATPVARLSAGADHSKTRVRLLRYTTAFSLAGVPALTLPCAEGGMQLASSRDSDEALLELASRLANPEDL